MEYAVSALALGGVSKSGIKREGKIPPSCSLIPPMKLITCTHREIRKRHSFENLKKSVQEGYFVGEMISIPLEKGTNKIYYTLRDNIQQKRLRKLDIIKIK
jgi:hypothetical protein